MFQISPQVRILIACQPIDFRKGIDALVGYCRNELAKNPFSGTVFVFRNKARTSLRMLAYDGQGFWLATKRLSQGRLKWWPASSAQQLNELAARELNVLLWNGDPQAASFHEDWKPLPKGE